MSESVALLCWRAFRVALTTMAKVLAWGFGLLVVAYCGFAYWFRYDGCDAKEDTAQIQVGQLMSAVKSYHRFHKAYPSSLDDLMTPKDGRNPFIDDGQNALLDPWSNRIEFSVITDTDGQVDLIIVWTTSPTGERIQREWHVT